VERDEAFQAGPEAIPDIVSPYGVAKMGMYGREIDGVGYRPIGQEK
jgi:hypothetical protein